MRATAGEPSTGGDALRNRAGRASQRTTDRRGVDRRGGSRRRRHDELRGTAERCVDVERTFPRHRSPRQGRGRRRRLGLGPASGPLRILDLPRATKAIGFVDARRGLAIGDHLGQAWSTTDGAVHSSPVAFPMVHGGPADVPLRDKPSCSLVACTGDHFAWASPRALKAVGYEPVPLLAPDRVPNDRDYPGPSARDARPSHLASRGLSSAPKCADVGSRDLRH